jgi:hypothetical protein
LFEHLEFETTDLTFKVTALPISWWFQVLSAPYLQGTSTAQMQVSMSWTDNMTFPITHFPPKQQCPLSALLWNTSCMWSSWTRHCPIEKCCYVFHPLHHWKPPTWLKFTAGWLLVQELGQYSLRNKGLCLVPTSCTAGIARSNGADIWAPIKSPSPKFNKDVSPFHWHNLPQQLVKVVLSF